jgi:hypothetical protein
MKVMRKVFDRSRVFWVAMGLSMAASTTAAGAPLAENKDAEQLFQKMEAKLSEATALELSFDIAIEAQPGGRGAKYKGTLATMSGNKLRLEMSGGVTDMGQPFTRLTISDGTRMRTMIAGDEKPSDQDTPTNLTAEILTLVARTGVFLPQGPLPDENVDAKDRWGVSGFKLGSQEKDGERELQRLEYQLALQGQNEPFSVAVWIDLKTGLPVKRLVTSEVGDEKIVVTETYGKLTLDEKLAPKTFELPE